MTINYTTGYAGTGKSTRLIALANDLEKDNKADTSVVLCPTHKAIDRLRSELPSDIEIKTIHSLLGWIPTINEDAEHISHIDTTAKLDRDLDDYTNIVIDEAGMMSEDMLTEIISKIESKYNYNQQELSKVTMHLFLDPYQLLPVKGRQIQIDPITTTNLTTQHRSESADIVELYTKFVNYLEGTNTKDLTIPSSKNVIRVNSIEGFQKGDRLLAYTNDAVGYYNIEIAKSLGINSYINQDVQLGSKLDLIKCICYIEPTIDDLLEGYEDGSLSLQNSQINKKFLEHSLNALLLHKNIKFIECSRGYLYPVIEGIGNANRLRNAAKEAAIKDKKQFKHVYALNRAYTMDYSFASTVHKAQGSEFNRVWVNQQDIKKSIMNNYYDTYARLMYVAISRAKKTLFVI